MAELKQKGELIETVEAEVVAGDAADLNVISMKGSNTIYKFILKGYLFIFNIVINFSYKKFNFYTIETSDDKDGPNISNGSPAIVQPSETPKQGILITFRSSYCSHCTH